MSGLCGMLLPKHPKVGGGGVRDTDIDRDRVSIYILIFLGWVNRGRYDLFPVPLKV